MESNRLAEALARFYTERREALQDAADTRRAALHRLHPELPAAERKLALAGLERMKAALDSNEETGRLAYDEAENALDAILQRLGLARDYAAPRVRCGRCGDTGQEGNKACPDCYAQALAAVIVGSGEADPLGDGSFDSFDLKLFEDEDGDPAAPEGSGRRLSTRARMERLRREMERYAENFGVDEQEGAAKQRRNLLFSGPPGTGKTYMASCLAKALRAQNWSPMSLSMPRLAQIFGEYRVLCKSFNPDPQRLERLSGLLEQLEYSDFLILDDLGTEVLDANTEGELLSLLNQRERSRRPLLVSTNLGPKELKARYDGRVFSRFLGGFKFCLFGGKDLRARRGD